MAAEEDHWFNEEKVQALIARFKAGDVDVFEELWTTFSPYVFWLMRGRTDRTWPLSKQAAEDMVYVVMAKVFENLGGYQKREGVSFISWLHTVTINEKRDELKRRARAKESPDLSLDGPDPLTEEPLYTQVADANDPPAAEALEAAEEAAAAAEKAERIYQVIEMLSPEEKALVAARVNEKLSFDQIAIKIEGSSKGAAKIRKRWERLRKSIVDRVAGNEASEHLYERGGE